MSANPRRTRLSFLDLPREIRDMIYEHMYVSPTGLILIQEHRSRHLLSRNRQSPARLPASTARSARAQSSGGSSHNSNKNNNHVATKSSLKRYTVRPCALAPIEPFPQYKGEADGFQAAGTSTMNLSLLRSCRQVYVEASGLFWTRNTFCFASPAHLLAALKGMGQVASRRMQRIWLDAEGGGPSCDERWTDLRRAVVSLASRRRKGCLQAVTMRISFQLAFSVSQFAMVEPENVSDGPPPMTRMSLSSYSESFLNIWETLVMDMGPELRKTLAVSPIEWKGKWAQLMRQNFDELTFLKALNKYLIGGSIELGRQFVWTNGLVEESIRPKEYAQ